MATLTPDDDVRYWAHMGRDKVGPYPTRDEAIVAARIVFEKRLKRDPRRRFMTGYGSEGGWFNIYFHGRDN